MNPQIQQLVGQVLDLSIEINNETECHAFFSLSAITVSVSVREKKELTNNGSIFHFISLLDEDSISDDTTKNELNNFINYALNLIKEQNLSTYKRIKEHYNG